MASKKRRDRSLKARTPDGGDTEKDDLLEEVGGMDPDNTAIHRLLTASSPRTVPVIARGSSYSEDHHRIYDGEFKTDNEGDPAELNFDFT